MIKFIMNLYLANDKPSVIIKGHSYPYIENSLTKVVTKFDSFDMIDVEATDEEKNVVSAKLLEIIDAEFQEFSLLNTLPKDKVRELRRRNLVFRNPFNPKTFNCFIKYEHETMSINIADKKWVFEPQS